MTKHITYSCNICGQITDDVHGVAIRPNCQPGEPGSLMFSPPAQSEYHICHNCIDYRTPHYLKEKPREQKINQSRS